MNAKSKSQKIADNIFTGCGLIFVIGFILVLVLISFPTRYEQTQGRILNSYAMDYGNGKISTTTLYLTMETDLKGRYTYRCSQNAFDSIDRENLQQKYDFSLQISGCGYFEQDPFVESISPR